MLGEWPDLPPDVIEQLHLLYQARLAEVRVWEGESNTAAYSGEAVEWMEQE